MKNKDMNDNAVKYNQKWKLGLRPFETAQPEFIFMSTSRQDLRSPTEGSLLI